jgi:hypothetical protein
VATREPTEAELIAAWRICARDTWPATFKEAMADPLCSRIVRITALHPCRPAKAAPLPARRFFARPAVDFKRAAAGDRDDD